MKISKVEIDDINANKIKIITENNINSTSSNEIDKFSLILNKIAQIEENIKKLNSKIK